MQVNGIKSYSAPHVAFGNNDSTEKKQINKKAIAAGVGIAAAAIGTTAYALKRGGAVSEDGAKFFTKLKEGFKSFFGENRVKYLETIKANLDDLIANGKKGKDGAIEELSKEAKEAATKKSQKIADKIKDLKDAIAKKAEKAAQGAQKAGEQAAETV